MICPGVTTIRGAGTPLISTTQSEVKLAPKIEIREPGATGAVKLAALTTPPALLPYSAEYAFVSTENSRIASTPMFTPRALPGLSLP